MSLNENASEQRPSAVVTQRACRIALSNSIDPAAGQRSAGIRAVGRQARGENEVKCWLLGNGAALTVAQRAVPSRRRRRVDSELCGCGNRVNSQVCSFPADLTPLYSSSGDRPAVVLRLGSFRVLHRKRYRW